jgi:hypothetical protein
MTQHITQEQAIELATKSGLYETLEDAIPGAAQWRGLDEKIALTLNLAIQHYIDNCTDDSLHELLRLGVAENKALQDKIANLEHSVRFAAALAQPASAPAAVSGWMPIESAPKPSGRLLLAAEGQTCYGHWYSTYSRWEYDGYAFGNPKSQPTHWMPLPAAPTGEPG